MSIGPGRWLDSLRHALQRPTRTAMALASDGSFIVYSAIVENPGPEAKPQIYLRRMDQMEAHPVAGTEGGGCPFLSPDDRWIGFVQDRKLKKIPVSGGVPAVLCELRWPFGADWGPDHKIIFSPSIDVGLYSISDQGGQAEVLISPDRARQEISHRLPHLLPGGRGVLFTVMRDDGLGLQPGLALLETRTGKQRPLIEDAAEGRYIRTGHLVFLRQGTLMAVGFDLDRLEVRGQPSPVLANVMQALNVSETVHNSAAGQYCLSDAGWLAYVPGGILPDRNDFLVRVDQKGHSEPIADFTASFFAPRFSPDGRRIAYVTLGRQRRVWIYDLDRGAASAVTGDGSGAYVIWTPDGKRLVFEFSKSGIPNLHWQPADSSSPPERLDASEGWQSPGSFTPDGSILAFLQENRETGDDVYLLHMKSRRKVPFINSEAREWYPELSPDGRWLAYAVEDTRPRFEVWVRSFPGPGGKWQISKDGGSQPIWSKDGKQLFFRRRATQAWVVDIRTENGFSAGKPRLLFERPDLIHGLPIRDWDLRPDGSGFVMVKTEERKPQPATEIILVQNWFEELKRLAPVK